MISGLQIVEPYPDNYIAIEGESLSISCLAADSGGYPSQVTFKKKSDDGPTFEEIKPNASIVTITNATTQDPAAGVCVFRLQYATHHLLNYRMQKVFQMQERNI